MRAIGLVCLASTRPASAAPPACDQVEPDETEPHQRERARLGRAAPGDELREGEAGVDAVLPGPVIRSRLPAQRRGERGLEQAVGELAEVGLAVDRQRLPPLALVEVLDDDAESEVVDDGEEVQQREARVRFVVVRPLGRVGGNASAKLLDEVVIREFVDRRHLDGGARLDADPQRRGDEHENGQGTDHGGHLLESRCRGAPGSLANRGCKGRSRHSRNAIDQGLGRVTSTLRGSRRLDV